MAIRRTSLSIPGNNIKMIEKGAKSASDVVVLDLEDSVPLSEKEVSREHIEKALRSLDFGSKERVVRINGVTTPFAYEDIIMAVRSGADGVVIPKAESGDDIFFVDRVLEQAEKRLRTNKSTSIQVLIESAKGVQSVDDMWSSSKRITALIFGSGDFSADIGAGISRLDKLEEVDLVCAYPRARVTIAAAAAGIDAIDSVFPNFKDDAGLKADARRGRIMGFKGKWVIHPSQINIVNEVFTPTIEELKRAEEILEAYEASKDEGRGAISVNGRLVDEALIRIARNQVEIGQTLGLRSKL